jgi:hypothetical protein
MPQMGYLDGVFCSGISGSRAEHPLGEQAQCSGCGSSFSTAANAQLAIDVARVLFRGNDQLNGDFRVGQDGGKVY